MPFEGRLPFLFIRSDANEKIGTGHVMRCVALGQAWSDAGGEVVFLTACSNQLLLQRLYSEGFVVQRVEHPFPHSRDWQMTERMLSDQPEGWLILDGYHFDSDYQRRVKEAGYQLMVVDDMAHLRFYHADIVLNQNIHAGELRYSCEPYTRLLLNTSYALLRREFLKWRGWQREIPEVARKVLITLGGSDASNVTLKVVHALEQVKMDGLEAIVVVGASNAHYRELKLVSQASQFRICIKSNVTNMPELMAWADVAVSAGGSTCWELAFMALPTVVVVSAENHECIANSLGELRAALNLGWSDQLSDSYIAEALLGLLYDISRRQLLARAMQRLVDGMGSKRVVSALYPQASGGGS